MNNQTSIKDTFIPWSIKWGRGLNLLGIVLCFGPCIALALMGIFPPWGALISVIAVQLPMLAPAYFYEPISFFPVLGIPGTYMSFLSGNATNLRMPAAAVAQEAAGVEQGSESGTIISTIGVAVSVFVNILILTIGVLAGSWIITLLPPVVTEALNLLLPALFAALLGNYIMKSPKLALFGIPLCALIIIAKNAGLLSFLPAVLGTPLVVIICVFGTMAFGIFQAKKEG